MDCLGLLSVVEQHRLLAFAAPIILPTSNEAMVRCCERDGNQVLMFHKPTAVYVQMPMVPVAL